MENGWIKLHRRIKNKGYYKNSKYVHLWMHLLITANHKKAEFMHDGGLIIVEEGQLLTGRKKLAQETGIKESTIEKILKLFEKEHQIEQQKTTKFRLITIKNWETYQQKEQRKEQQRNNRGTTEEHKQECKNDKNEKKLNYIAPSGATGNEDFNFNATLESWINGNNRPYSLIGRLFKLKGVSYPNREQLTIAAKRHVRAAHNLAPFTDEQINEALAQIYRRKEMVSEFTLETILKYITK